MNIATDPPVGASGTRLSADIDRIVTDANKLHIVNWWQSYILGATALLSSVGVVVAGMFGYAQLSALLGLVTSFLLAFDRFDPSEAKAQFYREIRAQGRRLQRDLRDSSRKVEEIRADLDVLELNLAKQIPKQGLVDAIRDLDARLAKKTG